MNIGLRLSFQKGSLSEEKLLGIVDRYISFEPDSFMIGYNTYEWNRKKFDRLTRKYTRENHISINALGVNSIAIGLTGTLNPHLSITIEQDAQIFHPTDVEILKLISESDGFIAAYFYDEEYVYVQSEIFENNLKWRKFSPGILETIKNTPFEDGVNCKEYDIRFNPGRVDLIQFTWLMAAWKMWFGKPFFNLIPKNKILTFPDALKIVEINENLISVQLFDKVEESHLPENARRQWKWRDWLDYDKVIKAYK